jgi:phosphate butyryltransferase
MIQDFKQLMEAAQERGPVRVALAVSQDEAALSALSDAKRTGLAVARLFGDRDKTTSILESQGRAPTDFLDLRHHQHELSATEAAILSVKSGQSDILLKGKVRTPTFLHAVLDATAGLRTERLLSDVFLFEYGKAKYRRLIMITDGGVIPAPDLAQKADIIRNAVEAANGLGNGCPKVAVLSAVETVEPKLSSTIDAAVLCQMNRRDQIPGCVVDGPLALDNAISQKAADVKGLKSEVAGEADILVCPNIEAANLLAKATTYFAEFRLAHVIVGATAPILIPSRADSSDAKLLSIALGAILMK